MKNHLFKMPPAWGHIRHETDLSGMTGMENRDLFSRVQQPSCRHASHAPYFKEFLFWGGGYTAPKTKKIRTRHYLGWGIAKLGGQYEATRRAADATDEPAFETDSLEVMARWLYGQQAYADGLNRAGPQFGKYDTKGERIMTDQLCPVCGAKLDVYLQCEPEDTETIVLVEHKHSEDFECREGCEQITRSYCQVYCEECCETLDCLDQYAQPCNANGFPRYIKLFAPNQLSAAELKEWMTIKGVN